MVSVKMIAQREYSSNKIAHTLIVNSGAKRGPADDQALSIDSMRGGISVDIFRCGPGKAERGDHLR